MSCRSVLSIDLYCQCLRLSDPYVCEQIGWAGTQFRADAKGDGVGDDAYSWAYDGNRLRKWHAGEFAYSNTRWKSGDVVGVLLDLDTPGGVMRFQLNGRVRHSDLHFFLFIRLLSLLALRVIGPGRCMER